MNIEQFKKNFNKYRQGKLTDKEEELFESELEKLDEYQAFLEEEAEINLDEIYNNSEIERNILRRSQSVAYMRIGLVSLVMSLLLLPTLNLLAMALNIIP